MYEDIIGGESTEEESTGSESRDEESTGAESKAEGSAGEQPEIDASQDVAKTCVPGSSVVRPGVITDSLPCGPATGATSPKGVLSGLPGALDAEASIDDD